MLGGVEVRDFCGKNDELINLQAIQCGASHITTVSIKSEAGEEEEISYTTPPWQLFLVVGRYGRSAIQALSPQQAGEIGSCCSKPEASSYNSEREAGRCRIRVVSGRWNSDL